MSAGPLASHGAHDAGPDAPANGPGGVVLGPMARTLPDSAESAAAVMIAAGFPKMPARALMALAAR